jgi:hypothetical protein
MPFTSKPNILSLADCIVQALGCSKASDTMLLSLQNFAFESLQDQTPA